MRGRRVELAVFIGCIFLGAAGAEPGEDPSRQDELTHLREELRELRAEYESRFTAIEERIAVLEGERKTPGAEDPEEPDEEALRREAEAALAAPEKAAQAPPPSPAGGGAGAQSLNPQISGIGDFLATASRNVRGLEEPSLDLREVELAFQAQLDPFARADFFLTVPSLEEVEMEEGYITFLTLPSDFLVRLGRVRVPFGRANVDHRPETFAVDRPDVIVGYFGEDGLAEAGATIARLLPNPWDLFMEVELDVLSGGNEVSFGGGSAKDLLYNLHYRSFFDLTPEQSLNLGASYATGVRQISESLPGRTHLGGVDVTYQWKPLARGKYRSFLWQTELMGGTRETEAGENASFGLYSFARYQLGRRFYLGGRFDYSQSPEVPELSSRSGSVLVDFFASEFQRLRLQYKVTDWTSEPLTHRLFFQWFYLIGSHGAHKF
jgi:hypothetical protein